MSTILDEDTSVSKSVQCNSIEIQPFTCWPNKLLSVACGLLFLVVELFRPGVVVLGWVGFCGCDFFVR